MGEGRWEMGDVGEFLPTAIVKLCRGRFQKKPRSSRTRLAGESSAVEGSDSRLETQGAILDRAAHFAPL